MSWNRVRAGRGMCTVPLMIGPGDTFAPQGDEKIEIYDPEDTRVWSGSVVHVGIRWIGNYGWHVTTLTGVSLEALVDTAELDKVKYGPGVPESVSVLAGDIARDALERTEIPIAAGTIQDGPTIQSLEITNLGQGLDTLVVGYSVGSLVDPGD